MASTADRRPGESIPLLPDTLRSGRYQTGEVLRQGLRLIEQRGVTAVAELEALREAAQVGRNDIDAGRSGPTSGAG